jgi:transcriptional regulator with XRE-family HTH domain
MCMQSVRIGQRIAQARLAKGLTQQQLAEDMGCAIRTVASWEASTRHPRTGALAKLADALDVPVASFYADSDRRAA